MASKNGLHISDVELDDSAGKHSIAISSGVFDDNEELLGVVKVVWDIDEIIKLLGVIEIERKDRKIFGETTNLTLLTNDAKVIYSSKQALKFLEDVSGEELGKVVLQSDLDNIYSLSEGVDSNNNEIVRFVTLAQSTGFETFNGLGWVLVFEQDIDEVLSPVQKSQTIIGIIIAILLSIGLAPIIIWHIVPAILAILQ